MNTSTQEIPPVLKSKTRIMPYLVGAAITFAFCFLFGGQTFCAGAAWDFGIALFGACFQAAFFLPANFLFQFLFSLVIKAFWKSAKKYDWILLNAPIAVLTIFSALNLLTGKERYTTFRELVADPIPPSVKITGFGRATGMDSSHTGLEFQVNEQDGSDSV